MCHRASAEANYVIVIRVVQAPFGEPALLDQRVCQRCAEQLADQFIDQALAV